MLKPLRRIAPLLITTALVLPGVAMAQDATTEEAVPQDENTVAAEDEPAEEVDISVPGMDAPIIVQGRSQRNVTKAAPQVVSVLSSEDIARTGEGDIAGALGRVTGLSVVGNGYVYVRGLGDRYSLALLNGSPLPSPEPLKRVVPLDLFPTSIIASSLVQKSYSVNFPGEFGGGVINLTTKAIPDEGFLSIDFGLSANSETTGQLGYTYFGSSSDWSGFDNGARDIPPALAAYLRRGGSPISSGSINTQAIASELVNFQNSIVQRHDQLPPNGSATITGGTRFELSSDTSLGVIASFGYSSKWRTRDTIQQTASTVDLSQKENDFRRVITDDRIVVNGLLGFGLEQGDQKIRWTNLFIRDTLKQARIGIGSRQTTSLTATLQQQDTAWFERQLMESQLVGEFVLAPDVDLDLRFAYANSQREAPDEFSFEYYRSNIATDPYGQYFINRLNNGQQGSAQVAYSDLNENLYSAGVDFTYRVTPELTATVGYAYTDTERRVERRDFLFSAPATFPTAVALFRPDYLLQPSVINFYDIELIDTNETNPVFEARLLNHGAYAQFQAYLTPTLNINAGVRFEKATQSVEPIQVFNIPLASLASTQLENSYWLPAATVTWEMADAMQVRVSASKTIARPQFRELIYQIYYDPESNRQFRGNPLLNDSQLYNAEARYEWYFDRDQRVSVAGFFKRIEKPIETFASFDQNSVVTSFANAPSADLYGAEIELQKFFYLNGSADGAFWANRRAVVIANYTYSNSSLSVNPTDPVAVFASSANLASDYFRDGSPLTGQSDHLVNLQLGIEDTEALSQQTFLLSYATDRVTSRGASGQPDVKERPGFQLDFVARQGVKLFGVDTEMKLEVRNILGTKYQEFQESGANRIFYNLYNTGTSASFGIEVKF